MLLDTHILIRWLSASRKLSGAQLRMLQSAVARGEPLAFSAMSLLEIALLSSKQRLGLKVSLAQFFEGLNSDPTLILVPLTYDVAQEIAALNVSWDPADRAIMATARVHRLRLVTSDLRIIESGLVSVIE